MRNIVRKLRRGIAIVCLALVFVLSLNLAFGWNTDCALYLKSISREVEIVDNGDAACFRWYDPGNARNRDWLQFSKEPFEMGYETIPGWSSVKRFGGVEVIWGVVAGFDPGETFDFYDGLQAKAPVWLILLSLSLSGATLWWPSFRKRPKTGCCANCGYDLRASKDRCPECGTPFDNAQGRPVGDAHRAHSDIPKPESPV